MAIHLVFEDGYAFVNRTTWPPEKLGIQLSLQTRKSIYAGNGEYLSSVYINLSPNDARILAEELLESAKLTEELISKHILPVEE